MNTKWPRITERDKEVLSSVNLHELSDEGLSCILSMIQDTGRIKIIQWYLYDHLFDEEDTVTYDKFVNADLSCDLPYMVDSAEIKALIYEIVGDNEMVISIDS